MSRKIRIASTLVFAGFLSVSVPAAASASSPLLSGYGGPGAGEQAIVGSTLLNRPGGGGRPGAPTGQSGSVRSGAAGSTTSQSGGAGGGPALSRGASGAVRGQGGSNSNSDSARPGGEGGGTSASTYLYPNSLRTASADSSGLGVSGKDLLLLLAAVATLTLIGALTIKLVRLQA